MVVDQMCCVFQTAAMQAAIQAAKKGGGWSETVREAGQKIQVNSIQFGAN